MNETKRHDQTGQGIVLLCEVVADVLPRQKPNEKGLSGTKVAELAGFPEGKIGDDLCRAVLHLLSDVGKAKDLEPGRGHGSWVWIG